MKKGKSNGSRRRTAAVAAPPEVLSLVERFRANLESYRDPAYKEARVRREFLDPFFEALGWDLQNKAGHAEAYKDVVHEDAVKVGGSTEAPDYGFRVGGQRKFFVEAKKPSVSVGTDVHPAYQLRRYAWSAKLPLAILTDFEELAVYDCRVRPRRSDKPSTARILYMTYEEYPERWGEVAAIFSKDAVLKGSFDRFAEKGRRRGTATVDEAFLEEIEGWRTSLARNLALRNARLSVRDLNEAVQRTIDRIIFLRMCEDRGVEPGGALLGLVNGPKIYKRLLALFERADDKYNSGLFHFRAEAGRPAPDDLTPRLRVDDGVLADIIRSLYCPESPYEFSVLGADILGQVYEQFLGKVIRLTAGHRAKVEEKPKVKKAGGVYYTPTYIVRYIVEETVGRLLASKTPREASRLRILDPACGSGSFLIGAFERLLDWHRDWYVADGPEKHAKEVYEGAGGQWRLTVREKRRILLNNIFGVDIDGQAVEVTKLSLLLKVLEGENQDSLERQMRLFHEERALPDLATNIKCGNSLIGPDFFDGRQMDLFDDEAVYRLNAFDWEAQFPQILGPKVPKKRRGFDAVIGNPPYVRPHNLAPAVKAYFWGHYSTFVKKADIYCCFIERAVSLLRSGGLLGFIISNGWLRLDSFEKLRRHLLNSTTVLKIFDFTGFVFPRANVLTCMLVLSRSRASDNAIEVATSEPGANICEVGFRKVPQEAFASTYKCIFDVSMNERAERVKQKIKRIGRCLGDGVDISFGLKTGDDSKFLTGSKRTARHKPLLRGENVHRYSIEFEGEYVWYVPEEMTAHRRTARPGSSERFEQPKVLVRDTGGGLQATLDCEGYYVKDVLIVSDPVKSKRRLKMVLGLLNSRLMRFYYETSFPTLHVQRDELASLPLREVDPGDPVSTEICDRMVALVERMLDLSARLAKARSGEARARIQRLIDRTDREIDGLVYDLYGLTKEEITVVEAAT